MTNTATITWTRGDRLAKALRIAGKANNDMALVLGVSRNTIGNYIADRTPIKEGALRLWAEETGVPIEWLKDGEAVTSDYKTTVSLEPRTSLVDARQRPPRRAGSSGPKGRAR